MKKINKLGFFSFVALLGIIGIVTENKGYLGFFGFLYYIRYFAVISDELFICNVRKAGSNGFFIGMAVTIIAVLLNVFTGNIAPVTVFACGFTASLLVFNLTLTYLEFKEQINN
jgi:hypothetical protein